MSDEVKQVSLASTTPNPAALGLAGFALTTFILSMFNAHFLPAAATVVVLGPAFFYGGLAQLLAGQQEYKTGNVFGATAFSTYGAFWMSLAFVILMEALGVFKFGDAGGAAIGIFLIAFTIFNTYMWIGSFRESVAVCVVFTTLEITFILLDLGSFGVNAAGTLGGYIGIICALSAWYTSAAIVLNTVYKKVVLPVGPLNK
jgi:succinate-acetate transporter protein